MFTLSLFTLDVDLFFSRQFGAVLDAKVVKALKKQEAKRDKRVARKKEVSPHC